MNKYTVLLLTPDYLADNYGRETYLAHVEAEDAKGAVNAAQEDVIRNGGQSHVDDRTDFAPLAVFEGHLDDVMPGEYHP